MEDEEAKSIQEDRDKELTKKYKELQNPTKPDEKQLARKITGSLMGSVYDFSDRINLVTGKFFQSPFLQQQQVIQESILGQDPDSAKVSAQENWIGPIVKDAATDVLKQVAVGSAIKGTEGSTVPKLNPYPNKPMVNVTPGLEGLKGAMIRAIIPKYSSGPIVQMNQGTIMYRPAPGIMQSIFMSVNPRSAKRRSIYGETFERARTSITEPELESLENELVLNWGMKDRTFRWDQYKSRIGDKSKGRADKRKLGAMFESVPFTKVNYEVIAAQRMPELRKFYGPLFTDIGLKPRDFQLHHQKPILASLPGYDGLRFGSDEWWDITEILFKNGLRPGDHERNLKPLVGGSKPSRKNVTNKKVLDTQGRFETPHSVTHKYLDTQVGDDGTLFWTQDVRDRMNGVGKWEGNGPDRQFRKDKWDEYAQIVRKSIDITDQAEQTFIDLYRRDPKLKNVPTDPQELDLIVERLAKLEEDGLVNPEIIEGSWQVNQMETIVSEVTEELQKSQADYNWRAVFGRDGLMQRFVDKREITNKELRLLKDLPLGEQLEALQKYTGMTIEDINLLIETRPNFDPIRFIKEHR
tara:strand:+ start:126 stop:1865 length:1740 start_codon:yes stop_codon:yes gene_type:complete